MHTPAGHHTLCASGGALAERLSGCTALILTRAYILLGVPEWTIIPVGIHAFMTSSQLIIVGMGVGEGMFIPPSAYRAHGGPRYRLPHSREHIATYY